MPQAVIFDYGVGNLLSLKTALEKAGLTASIGTTAHDLAKADAIALPGVGSFTQPLQSSMQLGKYFNLKSKMEFRSLVSAWDCSFSSRKRRRSRNGLALSREKIYSCPHTVKVPHMGWNTLNIVKSDELFDGIAEGTYVYFRALALSSPKDKQIVCTTTEYGTTFTSAIASKNIYGTQFHPEKSGKSA